MQVYLVGGAVRDQLLERPVVDRDWLVLGCSRDELLAKGFREVGRSFNVFLHPETHEEYSLPRTEERSLVGDLGARDLTINAMAVDETGTLHDPHGGMADLRAGLLRHVGAAFSDDPARVYRVARLAAELGFKIAPATAELMSELTVSGRLRDVHPERCWNEFRRLLESPLPDVGLRGLHACGAFHFLLVGEAGEAAAEGGSVEPGEQPSVSALAKRRGASLAVHACAILRSQRFGAKEPVTLEAFFERCRAPQEVQRFVECSARFGPLLKDIFEVEPSDALEMILVARRRGRPGVLRDLLAVEEILADAQGASRPVATPSVLDALVEGTRSAAVFRSEDEHLPGAAVGERIRERQIAAVRRVLVPGEADNEGGEKR